MIVDFNKQILEQLLYKHTDKAHVISAKFPKIKEWKSEDGKITLGQLSKLANYFHIPFGYFFLEELPTIEYPIPHFRTGGQASAKFTPSDELLETIKIVETRQTWAHDLREEFGEELDFAGSISIKANPKEAAAVLRDVLKIPLNWGRNESIKSWYEAFRYLIRRTEEAGVFVVVNGVVNNDNKRKLKVDEFRGFVLHDKIAPFVFVNNNDFISGKIFTLAHELAHILVGKSASFDNKELLPANVELEKFCDAVAAEFLVPEELLLDGLGKVGIDFDKLSTQFKVSRVVVARRLFDLNLINKPEFESAYKGYKTHTSEKTVKATNGGNFYNTAVYRIGNSFFNLIYSSVKQNKILYRDAFRLTSLTPKSFDGYIKKHLK